MSGREDGPRTGYVVKATSLLVLASVLALTGCAGLLRSYDIAPSGLTRTEDGFRQRLAGGTADSLFVHELLFGETAPGDELLRGLYAGVAAYHAGRYQDAADLLDRAVLLSEERVTKSISRSAFALISNDRALPYEPPRSERLLIPYYAALAYLELGNVTGMLVEARRLSALLEQYEHDVAPDEAALHAVLRVFAGALFQAAGERNDAAVAFRQAGGFAGVDSVLHLPPRDSADVLVFVEDGFVAHRVEQGLMVFLERDELHALREGEADARFGIAALISGRVLESAAQQRGPRRATARRAPLLVPAPGTPAVARRIRERCDDDAPVPRAGPGVTERLKPPADSGGKAAPGKADPGSGRVTPVKTTTPAATSGAVRRDCRDDDDDDGPYLLKVAWPAYHWTSHAPVGALLTRAPADTLGALQFAEVSSAVVQDFQRELPLIVARTLVRGAAKAAITRAAERRAEKKSEALGELVGVLGNVGNVLLERADTRSWHLLPGSIGVVRVRLPAGTAALQVHVPGRPVLDLGAPRLAGGETRVLRVRSW